MQRDNKMANNNNGNINNLSMVNNNSTNNEINTSKLVVNNSFASLESLIETYGPNYNWDEGNKIDSSYYQPLKEQLNNNLGVKSMSIDNLHNIINAQIEPNYNNLFNNF